MLTSVVIVDGKEGFMTIKGIIDKLYITIGMMLFDPSTGKGKKPDELDEYDKEIYEAHLAAIKILKKKESKLVVNIHKKFNSTNPDSPWIGKCPECGKTVEGKNLVRYCKFCGQAVKWDE